MAANNGTIIMMKYEGCNTNRNNKKRGAVLLPVLFMILFAAWTAQVLALKNDMG